MDSFQVRPFWGILPVLSQAGVSARDGVRVPGTHGAALHSSSAERMK